MLWPPASEAPDAEIPRNFLLALLFSPLSENEAPLAHRHVSNSKGGRRWDGSSRIRDLGRRRRKFEKVRLEKEKKEGGMEEMEGGIVGTRGNRVVDTRGTPSEEGKSGRWERPRMARSVHAPAQAEPQKHPPGRGPGPREAAGPRRVTGPPTIGSLPWRPIPLPTALLPRSTTA